MLIKQPWLQAIIQLLLMAVVVFVTISFTPKSDIQAKEIKDLQESKEKMSKEILDMQLFIAKQSEFNQNVKDILKRWEDERLIRLGKK